MDKVLGVIGLLGVGLAWVILLAALSPILIIVGAILYVVLGSIFALLTGSVPPGL